MAARARKGTKTDGWDERTRDRIETSMLVNRLTDHIVGKVDLSQTQLRAIEILLRKALPDLSSVEMKHEGATPFALIPQEIQDVSEWEQLATPKTEH